MHFCQCTVFYSSCKNFDDSVIIKFNIYILENIKHTHTRLDSYLSWYKYKKLQFFLIAIVFTNARYRSIFFDKEGKYCQRKRCFFFARNIGLYNLSV